MSRIRYPVTLAPALAMLLWLGACGGDSSADKGSTRNPGGGAATGEGSSSSTTTPAAGSTTTSTGAEVTTAATEGSGIDLADGRHPVYITAIDPTARSITFDVIQFLTGEAAVAAYHAASPGDPEGPPNDYYIVNENTKLRTAPVTAGATVTLVRLAETGSADPSTGTFDELPAHLAASPHGEGSALSASPYWITVAGGEITAIEEQYLP